MKLNTFYTQFLTSLGLHITKDGYIKLPIVDDQSNISVPATVSKKSLVLPTKENLSKVVGENAMVFHPLNEDLERGPSKVLEFVRQYARQELEVQIILLVQAILRLSASPALHDKLTPDQSVILDVLKGIESKSIARALEHFNTIVDRTNVNTPESSFIHLYLRRSGKVDNKSYRQVATVTFPIYDQLASGETTILGVKLSKVAIQCLMRTMEYIFPEIATKGAYSVGSNSPIAPKFEALAAAICAIGMSINQVINLVNTEEQKLFVECDAMDLSWADKIGHFDELYKEIQLIPIQRGNEGEPEIGTDGYHTPDAAPPTVPKENPTAKIRERMLQTDTPAWEHESPRRQAEPAQEPVQQVQQTPPAPAYPERQPSQQQVQQSTQVSPLTQMLRQQQMGRMPTPMDPYAMPYQTPMMQPHHMGHPVQGQGYPMPVQQHQGGSVLSALRTQQTQMMQQQPMYPGQYPQPMGYPTYPAPVPPQPYGMGHEGQPLGYYNNTPWVTR